MLSEVEPIVNKHMASTENGYLLRRLRGGISSENYQVTPNVPDEATHSVVFTLFRDPSTWGSIERENTIYDLVKDDKDVRIPKIFDSGIDNIDGVQVAFLLREFLEGEDLDTILDSRLNPQRKMGEIADIAKDLGFRLGALHRHDTSMYGLIGKPNNGYTSWGNYIFDEIENEARLIGEVPQEKQIGRTKAGDVAKTLSGLSVVFGTMQDAFRIKENPSLAHGDARFANFIAEKDHNKWGIQGMIDMEEATGGDPEIDIAFIENWLHFADYKVDFYAQSRYFTQGYLSVRGISPKYNERRLAYHALRSLSYLRTVFGFDIDTFLSMNSRNEAYVKKHFEILDSISKGNGLEDLDIRPLIKLH
jgi:aminoglycoside phosphotransferase (APT) family kinase protein